MRHSGWQNLFRLVGFLKPFWQWVGLSVLLAAGAVFAGIGLLGTSAYLIASAALHPGVAALEIAIVGVRFFGILRAVLRYLERLVSHSINFKVLAHLRAWLYAGLEPLAPARLQTYQGGDLLARSITDVETLENFYVRAVAPPLAALGVTCGVSWFVGRYDPRLGLILLLALLSAGIILPLGVHVLSQIPGKQVVTSRAKMNADLVDAVQGLPDLLLWGGAEDHLGRVLASGRDLSRAQLHLGRVNAFSDALAVLITGLTLCAILLVGIPLVGSRLDGVMLVVLCLVVLSSFEATAPLPGAALHLSASLEAGRRLFELVDASPAVLPPLKPVLSLDEPDLSIRDLSYCYAPGLPPALDHICLELPVGKRLAVVGASGAGKSTLIQMILRFREYSEGEFWLGGRDVRQYDPETVRRRMAVVPQSVYVFAGSLRQNILLANPSAGETEVEDAVCRAGLADFAAQLPKGLDTWVGERGVQLSGGERQRLALARMFVKIAQPSGQSHLLLFDEPAAHLDAQNEKRFIQELALISQGHALLLITHRLIGLEVMDEIIVLHEGRAVERGTHNELLAIKGRYAHMWQVQNEMLIP